MAVLYEHEILNQPKPGKRVVVTTKNIHRASAHPGDFKASVNESADLRRSIEAELLHEARTLHIEPTKPVTFGELADSYGNDCKDRETRWDKTVSRWQILINELGRDTPADEITPGFLLEWRASLKDRRKLSNRSVNDYVNILKAIFNLGVRMERIDKNPARHLRPYKEWRNEVEFLTTKQLTAVFNAS